jgi:hypothetical protein
LASAERRFIHKSFYLNVEASRPKAAASCYGNEFSWIKHGLFDLGMNMVVTDKIMFAVAAPRQSAANQK